MIVQQFGCHTIPQFFINHTGISLDTRPSNQKKAFQSWKSKQKVPESATSGIIKNHPQAQTKKRPASDGPICLGRRNKWTHQIDCLKSEVEELKAQNEDLKAKIGERDQTHKMAIAGYRDKVERCSYTLEAMLEARISKDVLIDIVQDLIVDIFY